MFALTRKTDYAIIALSHIARQHGSLCTAREIAERFNLPHALLMNLLKRMAHEELIRSIRGAKGGYTLGRPAEAITLEEVVRAIEGPVRLVQCADHDSEEPGCELVSTCPVSRPVQKVHARLEEFLRGVTLADIVNDPEYEDCCQAGTVPMQVRILRDGTIEAATSARTATGLMEDPIEEFAEDGDHTD